MTSSAFAVYGCSGFGREVMPLLRGSLRNQGIEGELLFIDDGAPAGQVINGQRVLSYSEFLDSKPAEKFVSIAIAASKVRQQLATKCEGDGIGFFDIRATSSTVLDENIIGPGAIICGYSHITSNTIIGCHFHANIYSYVAHDCIIGDYVTLAPGAKVNGNVVIEDHAYIGTGAIIKQGLPGKPTVIGRGAVVGMGAVVTKSVPPGMVVVGNPAGELRK